MMAASVLTTAGDLALPTPRGSSDDAAEIAAPEGRILIRQDICFHIAEGRLRLVLDTVIEGLDDVFFEMRAARSPAWGPLSVEVGSKNAFAFR